MNIFRVFRDNKGGIIRDPEAIPEAKILVNTPRRDVKNVTVKTINTANMSNYTKNRLHGNGTTAIYPTFVNVAEQPTLNGDVEIATITLKAKKNIKLDLKAIDGVLVDKNLNSIKF